MNVLKSHYKNLPKVIVDVEKLRNGRIVKTVYPEDESCMESYPCQHKGFTVIEYTDGSKSFYDCSSVNTGAIMYYYWVENSHFTQYIDDDCKEKIGRFASPMMVPKKDGGCALF